MVRIPTPKNTVIPLEAFLARCKEGQEAGQAQEMKFHRFSMILPPLSKDEFEGLVEDIEKRGQLEPVFTYEGEILDGRHRYMACLSLGIEPKYEEYVDDDPLGFVIAKNVKRRHLTASQRGYIAADLETLGHGGDRRDTILRLAITRSQAAKMMGVSEGTIESAKYVKLNGSPEMIEAVRQGKIAVSKAEAQIKEAAGGTKAKATADDAANKVTGEHTKPRGNPSKRASAFAEEQAARLIHLIEASCPAGQRAELAELAEKAAPYYGPMWRDLANRLRQAEGDAKAA